MTERLAQRLRLALEILARHPDGLPQQELWRHVIERLPLDEDEQRPISTGTPYGRHAFTMSTVELVKAGWLHKERGVWHVTGVGRKALADHPDPKDFFSAKNAAYQSWNRNRDKFSRAERLIEGISEGQWVAVTDVAAITGLDPDRLVAYLQGTRPEGWHRVLDPDGSPPNAAHLSEHERQRWFHLLENEDVTVFLGRADPMRRVDPEDLRQLAAEEPEPGEEPAGPRAWLVRGSSVHGYNLVPDWLKKGYCSLSAARLRELPAGAAREQVQAAVDEDYQHASYSERGKKTTEFHAFLSRMREGDLVVTNNGARVYLGEINGPPVFTSSVDNVANLQRPVRWRNADQPLDFTDLPDEMVARLSAQHDVLDLTEFVDDLRKLLGEEQPAPPREAELPNATEELARKLFVTREWLQECIELLRDQKQLIFYGPPGTGKTYLAQHLAAHLVGSKPENVSLVQFHPAYSYEDFFEGYRPVPAKDGSGVIFERRPGPFRRLVEAADENRGQPYVLIIDEINRANLAKVFGELYFLLEYRDRSVELLYSAQGEKPFALPKNVYIIGTMNTADRSIALIDAAMRRRFAFVELHPDAPPTRDLLRRWLDGQEKVPPDVKDYVVRLFAELNARIEDRDFRIGPSYLMRESIYDKDVDAGLERVWRTKILPLLEEHHYGDGTDVHDRYGLPSLRRRIGAAGG